MWWSVKVVMSGVKIGACSAGGEGSPSNPSRLAQRLQCDAGCRPLAEARQVRPSALLGRHGAIIAESAGSGGPPAARSAAGQRRVGVYGLPGLRGADRESATRRAPAWRGDRRRGRRRRAGARRRRMGRDGRDAGAPRGLRKVPCLLLDLCRGTFFRTLPRPISGPLPHVGCRRHRCAPSPGAEGCRASLGGPPRSRGPAHASSPGRVRRREAPRSRRCTPPSSSARGPRPLPLLWVVTGRRHRRLHRMSRDGRRR